MKKMCRIIFMATVLALGFLVSADIGKAAGEPPQVSDAPELVEWHWISQTDATASSVSMSWDAVEGATGYEIYQVKKENDFTLLGTTTDTSFTVTGLSHSQVIQCFVDAVCTAEDGAKGWRKRYEAAVLKTLPGKVSDVGLAGFWPDENKAMYAWIGALGADGHQFQILDKKGKVLYERDIATYCVCYHYPMYRNKFVRCRARAYIRLAAGRAYGAWSSFQWNAYPKKVSAKRTRDGKKIRLAWSRISGLSQYRISISTKKDRGYRKVKNLGPGKTSYNITKYGGKKIERDKKYYVKIKYVTKANGKSIVSNAYTRIQKC